MAEMLDQSSCIILYTKYIVIKVVSTMSTMCQRCVNVSMMSTMCQRCVSVSFFNHTTCQQGTLCHPNACHRCVTSNVSVCVRIVSPKCMSVLPGHRSRTNIAPLSDKHCTTFVYPLVCLISTPTTIFLQYHRWRRVRVLCFRVIYLHIQQMSTC